MFIAINSFQLLQILTNPPCTCLKTSVVSNFENSISPTTYSFFMSLTNTRSKSSSPPNILPSSCNKNDVGCKIITQLFFKASCHLAKCGRYSVIAQWNGDYYITWISSVMTVIAIIKGIWSVHRDTLSLLSGIEIMISLGFLSAMALITIIKRTK